MSLTLAAFIVRFPEFTAADAGLVQAKLDEADRQIDRTVWDDPGLAHLLGDDGQGYLAAHLLALSPFGNAAAMVAKDGSTTFEKHYKRLQIAATCGLRNT